jgi:pimeloyl-ACP methyl ester carboxylesterase
VPTLRVNGVELYHERKGTGPPLLFIMGATGDGGHFAEVASLLADTFTVIAYDRRGKGRSPRPAGWSATSAEEQADDAAALLAALGAQPAAVYGTSSGAVIALCLLLRRPGAVSAVLLHEPAMFALFDDPDAVSSTIGAIVKDGVATGGRPVGLECFWRYIATDAGWEDLPAGLRERMLASADTYLGPESGAFSRWMPDPEALQETAAAVHLLVSEGSHAFFAEAAGRLGELAGAAVTWVPGTHTPQLDRPRELTQAIRDCLGAS